MNNTMQYLSFYDHLCAVDKDKLDQRCIVDNELRHLNSTNQSLYEDETHIIILHYTSSSDYSGSTCYLSNFEYLSEEYADTKGVFEIYGAYDYKAIGVTPEALQSNPDLLETINSLEDYPVIDDEHLSNLEQELYQEAWNNWAADDFARELKRSFKLYHSEVILDECDSDTLQEFYESLIPSGEYYIPEQNYVYVQVSQAVKNCTRQQLAKFLKENK